MKSMLTGLFIAAAIGLVSWSAGNSAWSYEATGLLGAACWAFSGMFLNSFVSGTRVRANFATESETDRSDQTNWAFALFLTGLPLLVWAYAAYVLSRPS